LKPKRPAIVVVVPMSESVVALYRFTPMFSSPGSPASCTPSPSLSCQAKPPTTPLNGVVKPKSMV
jgi:hypothetical protein